MHYASVENISKSFGIRTLFKNISFYVEEGDKIAFVARNGSGKSTLLKIIAGLDTPDSGTIWVHKDIRVIMLQQDTPFEEHKSIWDNVLRMDNPVVKVVKAYEQCLEEDPDNIEKLTDLMALVDENNAWNFESELKQILGKLNLHHLNEPVKNLSGGQRKRVALAQSLIEMQLHEGRCLLILDEPTNHLDVSMIEWLEDYLSAQKVTLLLVTHDRYFLDAVCNEILEMDEEKEKLDKYYKSYTETFEQTHAFRILAQSTSLQMLHREASRLERTYYRALNNLLRLRQVRESSNRKIEKRTESQDRTPAPIHQSPIAINESPTTHHKPPATDHKSPTTDHSP